MRLAIVLSALVLSACHQTPAPPAADASQTVKANKEVADLLRKADALAASTTIPATAGLSVPAAPPPEAPAKAKDAGGVTAAKSKTEVMHDQAVAAFGDRLSSLRRTSEAARLKKDRYLSVCQVQGHTECAQLTADVSAASKMIEGELGEIDQAARRAGIDPALMHDLLAKYGF